MLLSIFLIVLLSVGSLPLTFLFARDRGLLWRLAVGNVLGSAICGTSALVLATAFGLSVAVAAISIVLACLPLVLLVLPNIRGKALSVWTNAKTQLSGGETRFGGFVFYTFFFVLFCLFFSQAMYQTSQGIYTGGSQNLGDLPFHLGAIFSFTDGGNFPPQNPSWSGAKFSYPFIADLISAVFVRLGAGVSDAMVTQDVGWAFSLLAILQALIARITGSRIAGYIAPLLLFFSGGLGFLWFGKDYLAQGKGLFDLIWALPTDYTIGEKFRWGNSLVVLFITQRSLLLGMPLTLAVIGWIWNVFSFDNNDIDAAQDPNNVTHRRSLISAAAIGIIAGTLPLIHLHSLAVLFVLTAFCFALRPKEWREWVTFGVGVCIIAIPELVWSVTGTASETAKFFELHFGWDKGDAHIIWFWLKNTGLVIPLIVGGIFLLMSEKDSDAARRNRTILLFYIPFAFLFVLSNSAKLAPWEWDNIKVLIYWFVGSLPLITLLLAKLWHGKLPLRLVGAALVIILIFAGGLDVLRTVSSQNKIQVFDADAVKIAEQIKAKTSPDALFMNAPTYNSAVVLSGRRSFMRYSGHLASHGIDPGPREDAERTMYAGGGVSDMLLKKNGIEYVLISPAESEMRPNITFFSKYPVIAESGDYKVYQIR